MSEKVAAARKKFNDLLDEIENTAKLPDIDAETRVGMVVLKVSMKLGAVMQGWAEAVVESVEQ